MDWRSTSRPLSLKMPFSNAYQLIQSSALMLLYAATTFVQQGRGVFVGEAAAAAALVAAGAVVAAVPPPAPPPQAVARTARTAMQTASVLVIGPTFPLTPDLGSPRLESVLDPLEDRREEHAGARDEDDPGQHLRRLEGLPRDRDELADAVPRGDELADHDTGHGVADAEPEAGQDEGDGAGQDH